RPSASRRHDQPGNGFDQPSWQSSWVNCAPSRLINGTKSGKLVAIGRLSSIATGWLAARPKTRKAIAMRWSSWVATRAPPAGKLRSEEHTSELQSHLNLVCRLLLEKKNDLEPVPESIV